MKKTPKFLAFAALVMGSTMLFAQEPAPATSNQTPDSNTAGKMHRQRDPNAQVQRLTKRLKLDSDQQGKLLSILTAQKDQISALREDQSLKQADRRSKMQDIRKDGIAQVRGILTDEQKQKFDEMQQRMHARRHEQKG